jgi:hypothetical protein
MDKKQMSIYSAKEQDDLGEPTITYYTAIGKDNTFDSDGYPITTEESRAFAKKVYKGQLTYYIKIGPNGKIYNPIGMFSEGNHNKFLAKLGKPEWKFTKVNHKVFDMYLNFLKTKNAAWLNTAQREMN